MMLIFLKGLYHQYEWFAKFYNLFENISDIYIIWKEFVCLSHRYYSEKIWKYFSFRRNIQDTTNFTCRFDGTAHTADCPIIPVGFILDRLKTNKTALLIEVTIVQ